MPHALESLTEAMSDRAKECIRNLLNVSTAEATICWRERLFRLFSRKGAKVAKPERKENNSLPLLCVLALRPLRLCVRTY